MVNLAHFANILQPFYNNVVCGLLFPPAMITPGVVMLPVTGIPCTVCDVRHVERDYDYEKDGDHGDHEPQSHVVVLLFDINFVLEHDHLALDESPLLDGADDSLSNAALMVQKLPTGLWDLKLVKMLHVSEDPSKNSFILVHV